jgi:hypothetical protein
LSLAPFIGVTSEGDVVNGAVQFSDGAVDFISIEPDPGLTFGLELGYAFRPKLIGVLGLSYTVADAQYFEDNNRRLDVGVNTLRIQPGVLFSIVDTGRTRFGLGGGATLGRRTIDGMVWSGERIDPTSTLFGLFGAAGLDIGLSARIAFHTHLFLEIARPTYGDLEDELARADGEAASSVDHDLTTAIGLGLGFSFLL